MGLYLGSSKQKISIGSSYTNMNFYSAIIPIIKGIKLMSYDNYILKDKNGLYLTVKESE